MSITYTPTSGGSGYYGAAFPYQYYSGNIRNCMGFACNIDRFYTYNNNNGSNIYLEDVQNYSTAKEYFYDCIQPCLAYDGIGSRIISSKTGTIAQDEYRIAMRIIPEDTVDRWGETWPADFHFWVQNNTGLWSEKRGTAESRIISDTTNPDITATNHWDLCAIWNSAGTAIITKYYNAPTIYIAIQR